MKKNECMRTKVRAVCLRALARIMTTDREVAKTICERPDLPIWFVLDPQSLIEDEKNIEWRFDDLGSCFMLADQRCADEDPRSVGAIQVELTFATSPSDSADGDHHDCEWTPWWASLSLEERQELFQRSEAGRALSTTSQGQEAP
jgi:hypothetical protein